MNRNRVTKFLFGGFTLVVLILALVFSLISCETQPASAPIMDSVAPVAPAVPTETAPQH